MQGIGNWLVARERLSGSKVALVEGEHRLTYRELNRRVNRLSHVLTRGLGVGRGDRVAILALNCIPYMELFFAAAKAGAVLVPLNVRLTPPEWAYQLANSGALALFAGPELLDSALQLTDAGSPAWAGTEGSRLRHFVRLERAPAASGAPGTPPHGAGTPPDGAGTPPDGAGTPPHGAGTPPPWRDYEELLAAASDENPSAATSLEDRHVIMYTSGTTGRPKGAVLTQGNHFWNALNIGTAVDLISSDVTLNALPMFHIGGIGLYTVPTLHAGGTAVIMRKFEPSAAFRLIRKHRVTHMFGVPAIWLFLQQDPGFESADLSSLRTVLSGGAPLPVSLIEAYWERKRLKLRQGMGLTETAPTLFVLDAEHALTKRGSVGKPVLHTEAQVWNDEDRPLPPGEVGEMVCRGPNLFKEYWQMPEATSEAFRGGWFHSGDLARTDEDGFFYIVDRKKEMIISGGENIYPAEVEDLLFRLEQVAEVAVIGRQDARWGEVPLAVVALKPGRSLTLEELQAFCFSRLARYKTPKHLVLVDALPRNAAGKVQKTVLRDRYGKG
jgi:fatty-acyl-CoA synthase